MLVPSTNLIIYAHPRCLHCKIDVKIFPFLSYYIRISSIIVAHLFNIDLTFAF